MDPGLNPDRTFAAVWSDGGGGRGESRQPYGGRNENTALNLLKRSIGLAGLRGPQKQDADAEGYNLLILIIVQHMSKLLTCSLVTDSILADQIAPWLRCKLINIPPVFTVPSSGVNSPTRPGQARLARPSTELRFCPFIPVSHLKQRELKYVFKSADNLKSGALTLILKYVGARECMREAYIRTHLQPILIKHVSKEMGQGENGIDAAC
ncbi:uncharacterized protein V6R79_008812 [Siganus canaliculatus]